MKTFLFFPYIERKKNQDIPVTWFIAFNFNAIFFSFAEPEPQFPYRQVSIKRGEDIKQHYELSEEIGR